MKNNIEVIDWQKKDSQLNISYNLDYSPDSISEIPPSSEEVRRLPFFVQEIGLTIARSQYYVRRSNLKSFMIIFVTSGTFLINYNGQESICGAGSAMWIDCLKPHNFALASQTDHANIYYVHMYGQGALEYFRFFNRYAPSGYMDLGTTSNVEIYFQKLLALYKHQNRNFYNDLSAATLLSTMCHQFIDWVYIDYEKEMPDYIHKIRKYLDQNYMDTVTLDTLSSEFYLSASYIQKKFKQFIGISPNEYLLNTRIKNAKKLLQLSDCTIDHIAAEVGFHDASYFILQFKKLEGMTPKEYRRQWGIYVSTN